MIEQSGEVHETDHTMSGTVRLGFNEIIPGSSSVGEEHSAQQKTGPLIPEFDLEQHTMAQQRRSTAAKRRGPGQQRQSEAEPEFDLELARPEQTPVAWPSISVPRYNAIIADIVARDLARLCGGAG